MPSNSPNDPQPDEIPEDRRIGGEPNPSGSGQSQAQPAPAPREDSGARWGGLTNPFRRPRRQRIGAGFRLVE
jgi:hypothetical protein